MENIQTESSATLTCDRFHHHVGHFRDFLIDRDTEHLRCHPVQGPAETGVVRKRSENGG